ncbi:MAG: PQQ-binding-like beta-propeller repeat protein [Candidatus Marinimicrobia bacterium]|nr:PQQ-binding-like beta-propeller repeat protein [Candidatus Neomarinimicrobiota bacterium]MCF7829333.1 PQQ-binding-like beta-propeller repeat protein [Candidatus Neomarinimicrobiota bacterium]MCF7880005.1 PQQ-binding-like beta-propeller repeat protein [Candidatus Neomarinimicrobiota bacterium]
MNAIHYGLVAFALFFGMTFGFTDSVSGQVPRVTVPEVAQTADVIFMGTVLEQESRVNDAGNLIVTDVQFRNDKIVYQSESAQGSFGDFIEITYTGGQIEELALIVSESPRLQTKQQYIVFLHADGKSYFNPVVAGSHGIFNVLTDSVAEQQYVLNTASQGITGVENGYLTTTSRTIADISGGEVIWAESQDSINFHTEQPPEATDENHFATVHPTGSNNFQHILTVEEFTDYILNDALTTEVTDPTLRFGGKGVMIVEQDGELIEQEIPEGKGYEPSGNLMQRLQGLKNLQQQGKILNPPETTQSGDGSDIAFGQRLRRCGYQDLPIVMEQFNGMATSNQQALDLWNMFMDNAYQMASDDGTFGGNNDENEFTGFVSGSSLDNVYGRSWGSALAKTMIWTETTFWAGGTCNEILETDVIHNPAYSWSDNLDPIINDTLVFSYRTINMHELGHTWGWQDGVDEQYNYDHPSVMHAGFRSNLVEDGWGIHAVDAQAFRANYTSQTSEAEIIDIGIESYYADNGLRLALAGKSAGDTTWVYDAGDQIVLQGITVENMSKVDLEVDIEFYLSKDRFIDNSDILMGTFHWGGLTGSRYELLSETYFSGDFTMNIPLDTPQDNYFVAMRATPTYRSDDFTRNNETSMSFRIGVRQAPRIAGHVYDAGFSDIQGVRILGLPEDAYTDANGNYEAPVPKGWSGTIQPDHSAYTFSPQDASFSNVTSDQSQDFQGTIKTYNVGGYAYSNTGTPLEDVEITGFPSAVTTNSSGSFSTTVEHGFSGTIVPIKAGYNFNPNSESLTSVTSNRSLYFTGTSGDLADSDWPMFRQGQDHTGYLNAEPIEDDEQWTALLQGDVPTSPAVDAQGNVYIAALNGVYSYDPQGSKRWEFFPEQVKYFESSPAVGAGPVVYIGSTDGHLYALDHEGNQKWRFATGDSIVSSPVVGENGVIYIGSNSDSLYAVNPDGSHKWTFGAGDEIKSSPAYGSDGTIYFGSDNGNVYAVDSSGTEVWSVSTDGPVRSSPAISGDGTIYVGSNDSKLYSISSSGSVNWSYDTGSPVKSSPAIGQSGTIFFGSDNGKVYALNSDKSVAWSYQTDDAVQSSPAVSYYAYQGSGGEREIVYVGSDDGRIYAITSLNTGSSQVSPGDKLWSIDTGEPVQSSPALNGNMLYVGSNDMYLHAIGGGSSASGMFAALGLGGKEGMEEIAIIIAESQEGGLFGDPAILGDITGGDGCTGGPLIIPACGPGMAQPGGISGFLEIKAGVPLRIGILPASQIDQYEAVMANETTEPLIGEFTTTFEAGQSFVATVSGLENPEEFVTNPDNMSTALDLKMQSGVSPMSGNLETVQVMAGNFITDSDNLSITLVEAETQFSGMEYGSFSDIRNVEPGKYTVRMDTDPEGLAKGGTVLREFEVDLRYQFGQTVTLFANGFLDPKANNNGPIANLMMGSAGGYSMDLGRQKSQEAISLLQRVPVLQDDYLLEPGATHPVRYSTLSYLDFEDWWSGSLLPYHTPSLGEIRQAYHLETESAWNIPVESTVFSSEDLGDDGQLTLVGQPADSIPEALKKQLQEFDRTDYTHLSKIVWDDYEEMSGIQTWYVMKNQNGFALPVAKYQEMAFGDISQPMTVTFYEPVTLNLPEELGAEAAVELDYDLRLYEFTEEGAAELTDTTSYRLSGWVESQGSMTLPQPFGKVIELDNSSRIKLKEVRFGNSGVTALSGLESYLILHSGDTGYETVSAIAGTEFAGVTYIQSGDIFSVTGGTPTGNDQSETVPEQIALLPNYPNPFNPTTEIQYHMPEAGDVRITVYDIRGKRVRTLVQDHKPAGKHQVTFDAADLPSGMYFYTFRTRGFSDSGKMILLK